MYIVILKDNLFYVEENPKGFIKRKKKEKNSNKLYSIHK